MGSTSLTWFALLGTGNDSVNRWALRHKSRAVFFLLFFQFFSVCLHQIFFGLISHCVILINRSIWRVKTTGTRTSWVFRRLVIRANALQRVNIALPELVKYGPSNTRLWQRTGKLIKDLAKESSIGVDVSYKANGDNDDEWGVRKTQDHQIDRSLNFTSSFEFPLSFNVRLRNNIQKYGLRDMHTEQVNRFQRIKVDYDDEIWPSSSHRASLEKQKNGVQFQSVQVEINWIWWRQNVWLSRSSSDSRQTDVCNTNEWQMWKIRNKNMNPLEE